jgi:UDP-N-acetyl-D-mannosaminuronic acid dehydrogenase
MSPLNNHPSHFPKLNEATMTLANIASNAAPLKTPAKPLALKAISNAPSIADVSIIGLGYVGLPLAAILADKKMMVSGVDIRAEVVNNVNEGVAPAFEPCLEDMVREGSMSGHLRASLAPTPAHVFIIAVPTPIDENKKADVSYVFSAIRSIAPVLAPGNLVVIESTSPVGTTEKAAEILAALRPDLTFPHNTPGRSDVMMAYCPERVLPGAAIRELIENSRTVGGLDRRSAEMAREFYARFVTGVLRMTDARAAELSKLAENSFRDVNIAFANELSMLCEQINVDVWEVIDIANLHPRVNILAPGAGVGGHCIPVDPWFIHEMAPEITPLIRTAREVNDRKPMRVVEQIEEAVGNDKNARIALLGLAYKPNVDDLRESPAVEIVRELAHAGFTNLQVVEPHVTALPHELAGFDTVHLADLGSAIDKASVVAILVPHDAFAEMRRIRLARGVLIDPVGYTRQRRA